MRYLISKAQSTRALLAAPLPTLSCLTAHAGRPLATEDAGTNAQAQCQVEAWVDSSSTARSSHLAPACGLIDGLELGFELIKASPKDEQAQGRAAALKWAPEWLAWQGMRFGLKGSTASQKDPSETRWRQANLAVLAISSLPINPQWTAHFNIGRQRDKLVGVNSTTYGAALVWTPHERWMVFGELTGTDKTPATETLGVRWWLLPDTLGLDVTTSRGNATPDSAAWGLGLGWYGIHF